MGRGGWPGPGWAEEQDHPALGQTWHPPFSPQGSEDSLGLHLRGHLPGPGQRSGAGPAPLHHAGHDLAPEGDCAGGHTRGACPRPRGPGGLASVQETCGPRHHHPHAASGQGARVEPGREHLAVHARELDLEPDLHLLRRHPRPLLRGVEQAHGSALAHHVHRDARLGASVLINETWYKAIDYLLKRWPSFTGFLEDGRICLSNNAAERAIRGIAVGRRNWTFAGSDAGGRRAAALYTLIETAKLNEVDPHAWLADVLTRLPDHPAQRLHELLPWNWKTSQIRPLAA